MSKNIAAHNQQSATCNQQLEISN